jgi:hypothetical protein
MAGVKITNFLGTAPKISPELLPNTAAQTADNCKLYSGDLIPYPQPVVVANTGRTGTIKTLYGLRDPDTQGIKWLSWTTDVDIAVASANLQDEQRFYYTGDGVPKISNYALATAGDGPYPSGYYILGLPPPADSAVLTTSAATFTAKTSSSFARDAGNIVTLVTSAAHGLRTGNAITVSGFSFRTGTYSQSNGSTTVTVTITGHGLSNGASISLDFTSGTGTAPDGVYVISSVATNTFTIVAPSAASSSASGNVRLDIRNFNATNVECTVVNTTTLTYFSPGPQVTTTSNSDGRINLGGLTQARSYVYTWVTPWDEESIASRPSTNLYIKEGVTVTVTSIPTSKPAGDNFVRGVNLYRTLASTSGTEYYLLSTLWFPTALTRVERTSNVSRVTLAFPHNLDLDVRFKISGCSVSSFNITGGLVTDIIDDYTFEYAQTAANVASTVVAAGTLFHDVSEDPLTMSARYWGDGGNYDFVDDFDSRLLLDILASDEYDPPPDNLRGLTAMQNNILAGFVGNTLYFSEPGAPHAWPAAYATPVGDDIVAIAAISGSLFVTTNSYPYIVSGSDPSSGMSVSRVDALYPCLSARSMVTMGYGVVYSTHDGLALYSPNTGAAVVTKLLYNNDTWQTVNPTTIIAEYYGENYFASHTSGSFVFEQDAKIGGFFVNTPYTFSASWYDTVAGRLYYVSGTNGDIYEWDDLSQPPVTMAWKSKVIVTKDMINLGAARVIADYADVTVVWDAATTDWDEDEETWDSADEITFRMWVNKELAFETVVGDVNTFRLPTGFRTDTYEFEIEGNVRVRALHLAETPLGLREA